LLLAFIGWMMPSYVRVKRRVVELEKSVTEWRTKAESRTVTDETITESPDGTKVTKRNTVTDTRSDTTGTTTTDKTKTKETETVVKRGSLYALEASFTTSGTPDRAGVGMRILGPVWLGVSTSIDEPLSKDGFRVNARLEL